MSECGCVGVILSIVYKTTIPLDPSLTRFVMRVMCYSKSISFFLCDSPTHKLGSQARIRPLLGGCCFLHKSIPCTVNRVTFHVLFKTFSQTTHVLTNHDASRRTVGPTCHEVGNLAF